MTLVSVRMAEELQGVTAADLLQVFSFCICSRSADDQSVHCPTCWSAWKCHWAALQRIGTGIGASGPMSRAHCISAFKPLQALAAGGAGLVEQPQQLQTPGQHRGLQAKRLAALTARQQDALCAAIDATALQLAPDHAWMQVCTTSGSSWTNTNKQQVMLLVLSVRVMQALDFEPHQVGA